MVQPLMPIGLSARSANRKPAIPSLTPEEETSLLQDLGQTALSGLGWLGRTLDKTFGGRALRGALGGNPRELLSVLPFSDSLGITRPEQVIYGRELAENFGFAAPNSEGVDQGDVLGFGLEVLLDPATYINPFGAWTRAGQLAKQGGVVPARLADQIRGFDLAEDALAATRQVQGGLTTPKAIAGPRNTMIPSELSARAAEEGIDIVPRSVMETRRVDDIPLSNLDPDAFPPGRWAPTFVPPEASRLGVTGADGLTPGQEALDFLRAGVLPKSGEYIGAVPSTPRELIGVRVDGGNARAFSETLNQVPNPAPATPLAGLLGIGLPFMQPSWVIGTGERAAKFADLLGRGKDILKNLSPIRYGRALLSPKVDRALNPIVQDVSANVKRPAENLYTAENLGELFDVRRDLAKMNLDSQREMERLILRKAETGNIPKTFQEYTNDLMRRDPVILQNLRESGELENIALQWDKIDNVSARVGDAMNRFLQTERALGVGTPALEDFINYVMRRHVPIEEAGEGLLQNIRSTPKRLMTGSHTSQAGRKDYLRGFPEGTTQINDLIKATDANGAPLLVGRNRALSGADAKIHLYNSLHPGVPIADARQYYDLVPAEVRQQINEMDEFFRSVDPRYALEKKNYFDTDIATNLALRGMKSAKVKSSADAIYQVIGVSARPIGEVAGEAVSISTLLRESKLTSTSAAGENIAERLAAESLGVSVEDLARYAVPREVSDDLSRWMQAWSTPEELAPVIAALDKTTNMFKAWLTIPFPAFHVRNLTTGLFNMWRDGALSREALEDAMNVVLGKPLAYGIGDTARLANPVDELDSVLKELYSQRVAFVPGSSISSELVGTTFTDAATDLARTIPGRNMRPAGQVIDDFARLAVPVSNAPQGSQVVTKVLDDFAMDNPATRQQLQSMLGTDDLSKFAVSMEDVGSMMGRTFGETSTDWVKGMGDGFNPAALPGVMDSAKPMGFMQQARKLGTGIEDFMRTAHYLAKRRQGFNPAAAAEAVKKYHFDYSDLTPFERSTMKRLIPFYVFTARNLPTVLSDLAKRPAKLAAATRFATTGSRQSDFIPTYLSEGASFPIAGAPEGFTRFISSFGLPVEDEWIKALGSLGAGNFGQAVRGTISGLTPLAKFPLEIATGRQLYSGRNLEDLYVPSIPRALSFGNNAIAQPLAQIMMNTPFSRIFNTFDKVIDPRKDIATKAINLGSGLRITDVDLAKQSDISARDVLQDLLASRPDIKLMQKLYVPEELAGNLTKEELRLMQLYKALEQRAQKAARQNKGVQDVIGPIGVGSN